jgi:hypothetical protein
MIPEVGKRAENGSHPPIQQRCDVLHDREVRSQLANESGIFEEKAGSFSFKPSSEARIANVLAGEAASDGIDSDSI